MPKPGHYHCPVCGEEKEFMPVRRAAEAAGVTVRTIYRWIEQRKVHAKRVTSGQWRICRESLFLHEAKRQWAEGSPPLEVNGS